MAVHSVTPNIPSLGQIRRTPTVDDLVITVGNLTTTSPTVDSAIDLNVVGAMNMATKHDYAF